MTKEDGLERNHWDYREQLYCGKISKQLPRLKADGLAAAPAAYVLLRRLERKLGLDTTTEGEFWNSYVTTGDALMEDPDGRVKYAYDFFNKRALRDVGSFEGNEFILDELVYDRFKAPTTNRKCIHFFNQDYVKDDVPTSGLWQVAARSFNHPAIDTLENTYEPHLLQTYIDILGFEGHEKAMGLYLSDIPNQIRLRALGVNGLKGGSRLEGGDYLGDDFVGGRLVGVAPEALADARGRSRELMNYYFAQHQSPEQAPIIVPTPKPILDLRDVEISDFYVKMPTPAAQRRNDLCQLIENALMDEETYAKIRKAIEEKK